MNTLMRIRSIICPIILAAGIVCPHSAQATLMLYTLTANGTGALGSFGFAEQTITITATADTSQIQPNGPTFGHAGAAFSVANQPGAIISVNGQSATFTGATMTFASPA